MTLVELKEKIDKAVNAYEQPELVKVTANLQFDAEFSLNTSSGQTITSKDRPYTLENLQIDDIDIDSESFTLLLVEE